MNAIGPRYLAVFWLVFISIAASACGPSVKDLIKKDPTLAPYVKEFLEPYEFFVNKQEREFFLALKTNQERDKFISDFLKARDPNKSTPENEWKVDIDKRIQFIKDEGFKIDTGGAYGNNISGFLFRSNGGIRGDPARVFLIHGMPSIRAQLVDQTNTLTDLMVWIYTDQGGGNEVYRFLFYQKRGFPPFILFRFYNFINPVYVFNELSRRGLSDDADLEMLLNDLVRSDSEGLFTRAIQQFSPISDMTPEKALETPLSADELIKLFKPRVYGRPPELPEGAIIDSNGSFSLLVAFPRIYSVENNGARTLSFRWLMLFSNLDWKMLGDKAETELRMRAFFVNESTSEVFTYLCHVKVTTPADSVNSLKGFALDGNMNGTEDTVTKLKLNDFMNQKLSPGNYTAILSLKDIRTNKFVKLTPIKFTK